MEMFALLLSWLSNPGCPVINRPSPMALAGSTYRPSVWHRLAQLAGFDTIGVMATSSTRRFPPARGDVARRDIAPTPVSDAEGIRVNGFSWFSEPLEGARVPLLCVGGELPDTAPAVLTQPCRRLMQLAGTELLQIDVMRSAAVRSGWAFAGSNPCPAVADTTSLMRIVTLLETAALAATAG